MKNSKIGLAALLATASMMGAVSVPQAAQSQPIASASQQAPSKQTPAPVDQQRTTKRVRALTGGYIKTRGDYRRSGPGWTNRHVKRMAVKARNVKRHRQASR